MEYILTVATLSRCHKTNEKWDKNMNSRLWEKSKIIFAIFLAFPNITKAAQSINQTSSKNLILEDFIEK
jgi:hypothetical protein